MTFDRDFFDLWFNLASEAKGLSISPVGRDVLFAQVGQCCSGTPESAAEVASQWRDACQQVSMMGGKKDAGDLISHFREQRKQKQTTGKVYKALPTASLKQPASSLSRGEARVWKLVALLRLGKPIDFDHVKLSEQDFAVGRAARAEGRSLVEAFSEIYLPSSFVSSSRVPSSDLTSLATLFQGGAI